ncbi:MAG: hypothetical protein A4E47_00681 [Methanosaeta sp. PtaU1.Bin028]|nr:MAG: hypothetical protein A4E47_00681 [Methanosaeta sp. PtaU1.Bin028]
MQRIKKQIAVGIKKADSVKHIVYGVVSEPDVEDLQGHIISAEEIENACNDFMLNYQTICDCHEYVADARVVQNYIAPVDFELEGQIVKTGSWVMAVKVYNVDLWDKIVAGEYTGFSIGGEANAEEIV